MAWKPNSESSKLLFAAQRALNDYPYDITLKQLYYLLVASGEVDRSNSSYRKLSSLMLNARKYGRVKPDLFVEPQELNLRPVGDPLKEFIDSYHINMLISQKEYIEVWVDKMSFSSFARGIAKPYDIEVFTAEGFSPYSFTYSAYLRILNAVQLGKIPRILYLCDFEPSSILIFESVLSEMASLLSMTTREVSTFIFRVMVLPEHIISYDLPYEALEPDAKSLLFESRYSDILGAISLPTVVRAELESVRPDTARGLILNSIFAILDYDKMSETSDLENKKKLELIELFRLTRETH